MKKLISDTGGMHTYLEIRAIDAIPGTTHLKITTAFDGAKDPEYERVVYDVCLDQGDLANLKAALSEFSL